MENPKKQHKGGVVGRYSPPKDVLERAKQMAPSVIAFDWSLHCNGDESPVQAKNRHFSKLRTNYGDSWTFTKPGTSRKYPSFEQIYTDPLWYNIAMNCASLPDSHRPAPFLSAKRKERNAKMSSDNYVAGLICPLCTRKKEAKHSW
jgi:hypothetical protein